MYLINNNDRERLPLKYITREYVSLCLKEFHRGITRHRYPLHHSPETLSGSLDSETQVF